MTNVKRQGFMVTTFLNGDFSPRSFRTDRPVVYSAIMLPYRDKGSRASNVQQ